MKKYSRKSKYAITECTYINGTWHEKYFCLYCDVCGAKSGEIPVDELYEEEGYPDGDYCWSCQRSMQEQGFVGKDRSIYIWREDV